MFRTKSVCPITKGKIKFKLPIKRKSEDFSWAGATVIVFDVTIKGYLKNIDDAPLLALEQEQKLTRRVAEDNDPMAREQLVRSNLRLVVNIAKNYGGRGLGLSDLIEEGNLGLIRAVDYFDPNRGTRFSTYAAWWIKQSIKHALLTNIRPVHIPTYMVTLINQWRHAASEMGNKLGRSPTMEEMADMMQLSVHKAKIISDIVKILGSIRDTAGPDDTDEEGTVEVGLEDSKIPRPEDEMTSGEETAKVLQLLDTIDPRQANILKLHYGLNGNKPMGLKEIGDKLGLTRERIRQIQREALVALYGYMNEE
jgi:RNA polymerase sigma factor (sigma-70 family)